MTGPPEARPAAFDGRVPFPAFASVETTMKCNLRCPMCPPYLNGTTVNGPHMESEDFERVAHVLFPFVDRFQPTVSGEPLMTRGLDRMLALAERYGVRCDVYTNGTLLDDRRIALLLPSLAQLSVSFDGATTETFEHLRAGASYDRVLAGLARVVGAAARLPADERPLVGLSVTLMARNAPELPEIVEIAGRFGLDYVDVRHVSPMTREFQRESLARNVELGARSVAEAADRARTLGVALIVHALDRLTVAMAFADAPGDHAQRALADEDGVVRRLAGIEIGVERLRPLPAAPSGGDEGRRRAADRPARRRRAATLPDGDAPADALPSSIWTCDFLWNKVYVTHDGVVRPCCVPGTPDAGDLFERPFEEIWDGEVYRAMRLGLVAKTPAPVCRGCRHIVEETDPERIRAALLGRPLPEGGVGPLPEALLPPDARTTSADAVHRPKTLRCAAPPRVEWPACDGALRYEVEAGIFERKLGFRTWDLGIEVRATSFRFPAWAWKLVPCDVPFEWRALAVFPDRWREIARGRLLKVKPEHLGVVDGDALEDRPTQVAADAPTLTWGGSAPGDAFEVQLSVDGFRRVAFSSAADGSFVETPRFTVPADVWASLPAEAPVAWRALVVDHDERRVVARGLVRRSR
ncbi:MAG TPA: radical SAM protein [Planctomycetota bacterium]|nr:radical SAM protein [Planctomycetota bacterium]